MLTHWPFGALTPLKYGLILADPPWAYEMYSEEGFEKSPEAHYETMPIEEIKRCRSASWPAGIVCW
ncbi:hypothetical protein [Methylobrevis pamukkalensis]|uniref:Uncharacterized protein n=1 Tax=Methylobrevis pamukkalensis TaxID=1439726 RepID=A0A1E3H5X0_9HYPH|nr:hypothetical protein [Methylobrevis pamukkalensis]ODN71196.1 hypothetical protein A6302_01485 [Methylobrevis pamukkalensis]